MNKKEIKECTSLPDVMASFGVKVNRSGFACCPFHNEKTPSMKVYKNNTFHCFGCGADGDVFDFVQKIDGVDFKEAYVILGGTYEKMNKLETYRQRVKREENKKVAKIESDEVRELELIVANFYKFLRWYCEPLSKEYANILIFTQKLEYKLEQLRMEENEK
jgi:DNA primase